MNIKEYFGSYKKSNVSYLLKLIKKYEKHVKKYTNYGKPFFKGDDKFNYYEYLNSCELNEDSMKVDEVFKYISPLYQCVPNWVNPGTMINVIPPVNLLSLAGSCFTNLFNPNYAEDNYSGRLLTAELEVVKYISELLQWNWKESHGIFTFGGKGTNLYATKIALNVALPDNIKKGINSNNIFMITSERAHPCHYEVCNWLGIGVDNCIEAPCDDNGCIKMDLLEKIICKKIEQGKIFLGFNVNGCSTVEFTVDPVKKIYELNKKIIKEYKLDYQPIIHVDAVIGWVWLFFREYDFIKNPLSFPQKSLNKIKDLCLKVSDFKYADSVGIDFHKTGFCPYVSSVFIIKDKNKYFTLNPDKNISLDELSWGNFAPFQSSLELTRASTGAISALLCLKSLGVNGFRQIIGDIFSTTDYFRKELLKNDRVEIINYDTEGLATLFIIKPSKYKSLNLMEILNLNQKEIKYIKDYNVKYGKFVKDLSRKGEISFTYTSSRSYTVGNTNISLGAIKAYPLSVFFDKKSIKRIVKEIFKNIDSYITEEQKLVFNESCHVTDDMVYKIKT